MKTIFNKLVVLALLLVILSTLTGFSPFQQDNPLEGDQFVVYGVPLVLVVGVILALARRYLDISEEAEKVLAGVLAVGGYLLVANLPQLELLWPSMPVVVPQILQSVLLFGAMLGFIPGDTASKVLRAFNRE